MKKVFQHNSLKSSGERVIFWVIFVYKLSILQIDKDGNGYLDVSSLKDALEVVGFKLPQWQVRRMLEEYDGYNSTNSRSKLTFEEFQTVSVLDTTLVLLIVVLH